MSERWPGGIINQTAPTPANSYNTTKASGVWTLDQAAYLQSQNLWPNPNSDQYFNYNTLLLLNGDGTNGAQNNTFLDSSTNNFTITRNGNTTQGSFSPYGNLWGNYFNGSNTFYTAPASADFNMGSGAFCYEMWICMPTLPSSAQYTFINNWIGSALDMFISYRNDVSPAGFYFYYNNNGSTFNVPNSTFTPVAGTWYHIVVNRDGSGNLAFFINGTRYATTSSTAQVGNSTTVFTTGANIYNGTGSPSSVHNGYISNIRAVKGYSVYDPTVSSLTVPTTPLSAITGTVFLTAQSNRFIDNSSSARTLTVYNSPSVQRFSPFNPTAPYSTSVIGGSGYFGTAGDYLVTTSSQVIPTGSYTIEAWVYTTSTSQTQAILAQGTGVGDANRTTIGIETSSGAKWSAQVGAFSVQSSFAVVPNTWTHVAMTFNGTTITLWVNGVNAGSTANVLNASNTTLQVGKNWGSYQWIGYISNARVSNTVRYTATFTPQTTPFTSDANTTFLGGMTNAGIPDLAMQNNLQTVGSAAVNTSVVKYGTGSLKFNGVGNYLTTKATPTNSLGSSNFTVEMWVYPTSNAPQYDAVLMARGSPTTPGNYSFALLGSGTLNAPFVSALNGIIVQSSVALTLNTWSYVAYVRSGNNWYIFVNGILTGSTTNSTTFNDNTNDAVFIGTAAYDQTADRTFTGYIDDLRVTNGYARYTANFTPPTAALPTY